MVTRSNDATVPVTLARGDGIGPEITDAVLRVLDAAGARLRFDEIPIGERQFLAGHSAGIAPESWAVIRRNPVFLKAPITTPLGGGYKSLNVTIRKSLNLFANVRPTRSYSPFVSARRDGIDLVVVRENEEDLYAGIEHQQTDEVTQVLKLITRPGSERIVRYAFEYARAHGRRRVTCMTKNNIMKHTDGLFSRVFHEIAEQYPEIDHDHQIIDIGAARLADRPESFDVIVTLNLYGDILSDIAAQVAGSVGLAGSANIGSKVSMFEAVHGSAPDIAGHDTANPSGMLSAAVQMLAHVGQAEAAERIQNAWLATIERGIHTADIYDAKTSRRRVGTREFADAVVAAIGDRPRELPPVDVLAAPFELTEPVLRRRDKALVGVDAFLDWSDAGRDPDVLGRGLQNAGSEGGWRLEMITNRGVKVWPKGLPETFRTDHWRCRFVPDGGRQATNADLVTLLGRLGQAGFDVIKTENLYTFDGERAFSLGQGQ